MIMLIYGLMVIACSFIVWSFLQLSYERVRQPNWRQDIYFWLVTGAFWVGVGLFWFSIVRVWHSLTLPEVPFVQNPAAAIVASVIILLGLTFKVRAIALSKPRAGWWFLGMCGLWTVFSVLRG